ncbi:carboxypeptidase regulatory-like domain-containing protein [Candidatus Woesearchaeota archaeon]|nr:carboxypeptidase regulatory-like domain-containing protein [Candidatus Woesearchaeota archaeon]
MTTVPFSRKLQFALIMVVLVSSLAISLFFFKTRSPSGYAVVDTDGGTITALTVIRKFTTGHWQGYYGLELMLPGYEEQQTDDASPGDVDEKHLVFNCLEPGRTHEVFATSTDPSLLDWSTTRAATTGMLDSFLNISPSADDSGNRTFTNIESFEVGNSNVSTPAAYMKQYNNESSTVFPLGILNVSNYLVFVTKKTPSVSKSYKYSSVNYQMMVGLPNATTTYYFLSDPYDSCPEGLGIGLTGDGIVAGVVRDNQTGEALSAVTVSVGASSGSTNSTGGYNFSVATGSYSVIGMKDGYNTHISSIINITLAQTTVVDFNLTQFTGYRDANGSLSGFVFDNSSGLPVSNASISVQGSVVNSNGSGYYLLNTTPGTHNIIATKASYGSFIANVTVIANQTAVRNITMTKVFGSIEGFISDLDYSVFINNATVIVGGKTVFSSSSGFYSMNISGGDYTLIANRSGYEAYVSSVNVVPGNVTYKNISMRLLYGSLDGFVYENGSMDLLANVTVSFSGSSVVTNSSGFFNFTSLKGTYNIVATKQGYNPYVNNITISAGSTVHASIYMSRFVVFSNGTIRGYAIDNSTNLTVSGVTVSINGINSTTDSSGLYSLNVTEGKHVLIASKSGYDTFFKIVDVVANEVVDENLSMVQKVKRGTPASKKIISNLSITRNITSNQVEYFSFFNESLNFSATLGVLLNVNRTNVIMTATIMSSPDISIPDFPVIYRFYDFSSDYFNSSEVLNISFNITYPDSIVPNFFNESYLAGYYYNESASGWERLDSTAYPLDNSIVFMSSHLSNYVIGLKTGTLVGNVSDDVSKSRLPGVIVSSGGLANISGQDGTYIIDRISAGSNTIIAYTPGYSSYVNFSVIEPDTLNSHNISLSLPEGNVAENGTLMGFVRDEVGIVLSGVSVSIAGNVFVTDNSGFYSGNVSEGSHVIVATKTGYNNYIGNITVLDTTWKNITMSVYVPSVIVQIVQGGGGGEGSSAAKKVVKAVDTKETSKVEYEFSLEKITAKLRKGTFSTIPITIKNHKKNKIDVTLEVEGDAAEIVKLNKKSVSIAQGLQEDIEVSIFGKEQGIYNGKLKVDGTVSKVIPIEVVVYSEEKLPVEALLLKLRISDSMITIGDRLKYRIELQNLLQEEKFALKLSYNVSDRNGFSAEIGSDEVELKTSAVLVKSSSLPENMEPGDYDLVVKAEYIGSSSYYSSFFSIRQPFYKYAVFGIPLWVALVAVGVISTATFGTVLYRKRAYEKKRYKVSVSLGQLPKEGPRGLFVGKIAESSSKAILDIDQLPMHTLIAGASGSGKSIAGQVIVEEALSRGVSVFVFDQTAQWTGFLRPCREKKNLALFSSFGMKPSMSRAFAGNIKNVEDEYEPIDFKKTSKPGEINVLVTKDLDSSRLDVFLANVIDSIFSQNMPEEKQIKYLLVFDGIHNLLPKFGGPGNVFVKIERAVREFRKWGIGIIVISQTTSDFSDSIKANINTQIMLRLRDEKDMELIKEEYGEEALKSLIKSEVGVAMIQNAAYNQGKPYFITFRPVVHDTGRLSDEELTSYNKYNQMIDDIEFQVDQLEELKIDVFDLKLGLKMVSDKVKSGNFSMADIYVQDLKTNLDNQFKKAGKEPRKKERAARKQESETPNDLLRKIEQLIGATFISIEAKNLDEALASYSDIQKAYHDLKPEDKKLIAEKCVFLQRRIAELKR